MQAGSDVPMLWRGRRAGIRPCPLYDPPSLAVTDLAMAALRAIPVTWGAAGDRCVDAVVLDHQVDRRGRVPRGLPKLYARTLSFGCLPSPHSIPSQCILVSAAKPYMRTHSCESGPLL